MKKFYYIIFFTIVLVLPSLILSNFVELNYKALIATIFASVVAGWIIEIAAVRHGKKDKSFVYEYSMKGGLL